MYLSLVCVCIYLRVIYRKCITWRNRPSKRLFSSSITNVNTSQHLISNYEMLTSYKGVIHLPYAGNAHFQELGFAYSRIFK